MQTIRIEQEIEQHPEARANLEMQGAMIRKQSPERLAQLEKRLADKLASTTGFTRRILDHMEGLHRTFLDELQRAVMDGGFSAEGYANYLVQAWYHTRHTPEFEARFTDRLREHLKERSERLDGVDPRGNKFKKLLDHGIDEEKGHELWALMDILDLGVREQIDINEDVLPETKALVRTQYDRLARLPFKGFLGYSFYLELFVAVVAPRVLHGFSEVLGNRPENHRFIYNHYVVDLDHAVDNIELLDFLIESEEDFEEVIDNMNLIDMLYVGFTRKSLSRARLAA